MKDIDFDELDRAVGSVLGAEPAKESDAAVATATADPQPVATPAVSASDPARTSSPDSSVSEANRNPAAVSPAISPARKRGQFLDMVHPSADMTKTPKMPSAARKTVQPLNPAIAPEAPIPQPTSETLEAPLETTAQPAGTEADQLPDPVAVVAEEAPETSRESWPDPLDFAPVSSGSPSESDAEPVADIEPADEPVVAEPAQMPFVADAKVDKRPLGAFAAQEDETADPETAAPAVNGESAEEETPEFNVDVNSVESAGLSQDEPAEEVISSEPAGTGPTSQHETAAEMVPDEAAEPAEIDRPTPPAAPLAAGQAASIPQQYKTAEAHKPNDEAHPLFDVEEYHQPLLTDGKKKSKKVVLIVVLLLILLVLGAALGYIAYTVGI